MKKNIAFALSGIALSMLIAGSAWSAITSSPTATVKGRAPTMTPSTIASDDIAGNGLIDVGNTVTISVPGIFNDEDGDEPMPETYQWQADGADIAGATSNTYTITASDLGKSITVLVTPHTDPDITDPAVGLPVASNTLAVVASGIVTDVAVTGDVNGYPQVDSPLAVTATCAGGSCGTLTYQWQLETGQGTNTFSDISGATGNTYTPVRTDQKLKIQVVVKNAATK